MPGQEDKMDLLFHIVFALFAVSAGVSLLTYAFFWYENYPRFRGQGPDAPDLACSQLIEGIVSSIASMILVVIFFPLGFLPRFRRPQRISPLQPVIVLIHGLYHNASASTIFRHRLGRAGFDNLYSFQYRSLFTSFERTYSRLDAFLRRLRAEFPGQDIILVGHSLGGLLSRVYAERCPQDSPPRAVITLGTPHKGSKMAAFGIGTLASSLIYRGPLFEELERSANRLPCTGVVLYSPTDNLVIPSEGLETPYPGWLSRRTPAMSHVAMLYSPVVAREVVEFLKTTEQSS